MSKVIIFDVDGTLAETEEVHRQAFNETFAHFGLGWNWTQEHYRELLRVTGGKERIRHFLDVIGVPRAAFSDDRIAALHADKTNRYVALLSSGESELRPGIRALIEAAKQSGFPLAIATTTSRENVECLLEGAFGPDGLSMFEAIICGNDVPKKKPAPDVYIRVMEQLGVSPSDCIAVEDSRNGMLAAQAAGIRVAITPAFYTAGEDFTGADWVFDEKGPTLEALIAVPKNQVGT